MRRSRRQFLKESSVAFAGAGLLPFSAPGVWRGAQGVSPNDRIRVGVIGCNGMGLSDLRSLLKLPEVECAALCDVDSSVLHRRAADLEQLTGRTAALHEDFRRVLDDREIDAVVIGTPDGQGWTDPGGADRPERQPCPLAEHRADSRGGRALGLNSVQYQRGAHPCGCRSARSRWPATRGCAHLADCAPRPSVPVPRTARTFPRSRSASRCAHRRRAARCGKDAG